ncbi:MAG: hypothetical protein Kow0029_06630 [Candidatus Rifleibacteriota bacterium]
MQIIDDVLISEEAWNTRFSCNLGACLGKCCQYGDLGAPISEQEEDQIRKNLDNVFPYLAHKNKSFLLNGISEIYKGKRHIREIEANTPCPLAYVNSEQIILCSLHSYCTEKKIPVLNLKPLWCSLFPMVIQKHQGGWMINVHQIPEFCVSKNDALPILLSNTNLLSSFFGKDWVNKLRKLYAEEGIFAT